MISTILHSYIHTLHILYIYIAILVVSTSHMLSYAIDDALFTFIFLKMINTVYGGREMKSIIENCIEEK